MKIALVLVGFHESLGGYGRHVYLFAKELLKRKHDVTILTTTYSPAGVLPEGESFINGLRVIRFKDSILKITPGLIDYLVNNKQDIVHVYGYQSFQPWLVSLAKKKRDFPVVFTPFYHPFGEHPRLMRKLFDDFIGRKSLSYPTKVIVQTDVERDLLTKMVKREYTILPIPVDVLNSGNSRRFRNKFKLGLERVILSVGRLSPEKRFDELIKAFIKSGVKARLVIAGKGDIEYTNYLKSLSNSNVLFTGFIDDSTLADAYASADLFVLVSKYESFGLVFAEAMSYGVPVIGLNIGGAPFVINNAGIVLDSINELPNALSKIMSDDKLRKSLSKKALMRAKDFKVEVMVNHMIELYKKLSKGQRGQGPT